MTSFWRHFKYLRIVTKFRGSYCDCNTITNRAGIVLRHEQTFHLRLAYQQVRRMLMRLRHVTFHMTICGISHIGMSYLKNQTPFFSVTRQLSELRPRSWFYNLADNWLSQLRPNAKVGWSKFELTYFISERNGGFDSRNKMAVIQPFMLYSGLFRFSRVECICSKLSFSFAYVIRLWLSLTVDLSEVTGTRYCYH